MIWCILGLCPRSTGGAYSAPRPLAGFGEASSAFNGQGVTWNFFNNFGPDLPSVFQQHEILSKIVQIVCIECQILRLKCTKFDISWVSALDPAVGTHGTPSSLTGFNGAYF